MRRLSAKQDAFGQAMWDVHRGTGHGTVVLERDDGLVEPESMRSYFSALSAWPPHQRRALRLIRGRVLDVGCGAGRHSVPLQARGFDVTGIDESPGAVRTCRARGLKKVRLMSFTEVSPRLGVFDTVIMFGNNFGLVGNPRRARWWLRRLRAATSDRARLLAETVDPYGTKAPEHLAYHRTNRRRDRMAGQVRIRVRYRMLATPWLNLLLVSQDEMRELLDGTGWRLARVIDTGSPMYVAVIEKERAP